MKKILLTVCTLSFFSFSAFAAMEIEQSQYEGLINRMITTSDGGCAVTGRLPGDNGGVVLRRYGPDADLKWEKTWDYGQRDYHSVSPGDEGLTLRQMPDGGFIVLGDLKDYAYIHKNIDREGRIWLIRTDKKGNEMWKKEIPGGSRDYQAVDIALTTDGGFAIAANAWQGSDVRAVFIKTDADGNVQIDKDIPGWSRAMLDRIVVTGDGGYLVLGHDNVAGNADTWLIKLNSNGEKEWDKHYEPSLDWAQEDFAATGDGGYVIPVPLPGLKAQLVKVGADGKIAWEKKVPMPHGGYINGTVELKDGEFFLTGVQHPEETKDSYGKRVLFYMKMNSAGEAEWSKVFKVQGKQEDEGQFCFRTKDGGQVVIGTSRRGEEYTKLWVLKAGPDGAVVQDKTYISGTYTGLLDAVQAPGGFFILVRCPDGSRWGAPLVWKAGDNGKLLSQTQPEAPPEPVAAGLKTGDIVFAEWTPNDWYRGKISGKGQDCWNIEYDDGDGKCCTESQIVLDRVPKPSEVKAGSKVLAMWSNGRYYPGKISTVKGNSYSVTFDDGDTATVGIAKIRLR